MSTVTLYLHIGSGKTGTTAVQRFLAQSFSELLELGVLHPNLDEQDISTPTSPDYWQGRYFENSNKFGDLELFNRCIEYCQKNSLHSIVISDEAFLVNWRERIGALAGKLDANVKIICYLRRQDHYLESIWKQWGYNFFSADELLDSMDRPEWGAWGVFDWYKTIEPWANNFGKENIIIRPYEKEQLPEGILPDFLNTIGVVWPEKPTVTSGLAVNVGFSRDVLEFLYLNRNLQGSAKDAKIYKMLNSILDDNFRKSIFDVYGVLSPKDRIKLLEKYETSNQMVAKEYLHRQDGRLFYEPWPDSHDEWKQYEGLNTETLTPILTQIIYTLYEKQKNLERQYQVLNQQQQALQGIFLTSRSQKLKRFLRRLLSYLRIIQ